MTRPTILVDTREQRPFVFSDEVDVQTATLHAGDYSIVGCSDRIVFERKSLPDLVACVTVERERFMDCCRRLGTYERAAIIVEASVSDVLSKRYTGRTNPRSVIGTCNAIFLDYRVPTFWLGDPETAARAVEKMLVRFWKKS